MIKIIYEPEKNRVAAYDQNKNIGEVTFSKSEKLWIIDHTLIDNSYGGQGISKKLVAELVDQARKIGVKIMPLCPFAKKEFEKRPEYFDILKKW